MCPIRCRWSRTASSSTTRTDPPLAAPASGPAQSSRPFALGLRRLLLTGVRGEAEAADIAAAHHAFLMVDLGVGEGAEQTEVEMTDLRQLRRETVKDAIARLDRRPFGSGGDARLVAEILHDGGRGAGPLAEVGIRWNSRSQAPADVAPHGGQLGAHTLAADLGGHAFDQQLGKPGVATREEFGPGSGQLLHLFRP